MSHVPFIRLLLHRWPAGLYLRSIIEVMIHAKSGHPTFLLGHKSTTGWWYYFAVLATYKIPLGTGLIMVAAVVSIMVRKSRWEETPLIVAILVFAAMCLSSTIFRLASAMPCPGFSSMIVWASRTWVDAGKWRSVLIIAAVMSFVEVTRFHPNYLSYINVPRDRVWLKISDSNLDWGQGLKQARHWVNEHDTDGRPVTLLYFGTMPEVLDPHSQLSGLCWSLKYISWISRSGRSYFHVNKWLAYNQPRCDHFSVSGRSDSAPTMELSTDCNHW